MKPHDFPDQKPHFKITVGDKIDPQPFLVEGERLSKTNRRLNAALRDLFVTGIEGHERSG